MTAIKYKKVAEVCEIIMGQSPSSDTYNDRKEGLPFFQGKADFGKLHPTPKTYCSAPLKVANENDILMSVRAPVGDVNIANTKCCIGRGLAAIRANNDMINYKYLFYALNYKKNEIESMGTGSTFKAISKKDIESIQIPVFDIENQVKIVKALDKAQELIDKRKAQIEALDQLTKSVFLEMFGDPVANKTWERRPLKDITDVRDGTHDSPKYVPSGYPLVTSKNIKNGKIDLSNVNYISEEDFININKRSKVDIGDIIMPMIGTIGNPIIVDEQPNFAIKNVALIKFNNPCVINIYIKYLLDSHYLDYILNKNKRGGTQKFLSLTDIRNMEIPLPPRDLQAKFSEIVKKVDSQKAILHKSLTELENNFNSLMQRAFKGELFND
ncbi:restriction endonuclease subunit S [Geobacillus kaustophilus]|uniref:restriction endonuclease subunit S n=1 Tax=Geobacillus kaustophilus TaxID=1462 RepID=UPI002E23626D|nr:restriction endonuclease subunit S [Geobacillus kaustophilus]MED3668117.1 restriction endonuclease subunit S [Geobacillus kaustophilus]